MATKTRRINVFNHVSMDGFFVDKKGDMSWAHMPKKDEEWNSFVENNAKGDSILLFGRVTYDLMAGYWPSPMAQQHDAALADRMNKLQKIVFSKTLDKVSWQNTTLVKGGLAEEIRKMKKESGPDIVIFGSGTIISQLAQEGLIDEYQLVVNPIILGAGRTMFEGVKEKLNLKLTQSRAFANGNVFLCYQPVL